MRGRIWYLIFGLILLTTASGCTTYYDDEQPSQAGYASLTAGQSIGQTFTASYDGLESLAVYLFPVTGGEGEIQLQLKTHPEELLPKYTIQLPVREIIRAGYYSFQFPAIKDSNRQFYYYQLEILGEGGVEVGTAPGSSYLNGSLYRNQEPVDEQSSFRLGYKTDSLFLGLLRESGRWILWLGFAMILFIFPGWALLDVWLPIWGRLQWTEKVSLAGGISLALYPLLMLWTRWDGLHLGPGYAWAPVLVGVILLSWKNRKRLKNFLQKSRTTTIRIHKPAISAPDLTLVLLMVLIFISRFMSVRTLDVPMWGDSYLHSMITQLIVENNGLFDSWKPYADLQTFTYHFGFHSLSAVFHWATGLESWQAVLWVGQILNGFSVIFLAPIARRIFPNHWSGVAAVLFAGLLFQQPMEYVNWGRYTQLAAQTILPAAIWLLWLFLDAPTVRWRLAAMVSLIFGGLALTHYRVLIFAAAFCLAALVMSLVTRGFRRVVSRLSLATTGALLLTTPWIMHMFSGKMDELYLRLFMISPQNANPDIVGSLVRYLPMLIWLVVPAVIGWGLLRKQKDILLLCLWWLVLFLLTNPQLIYLSGTGVITNFALVIAAYLPISWLLGGFTGWVIHLLSGVWNRPILQPVRTGSVFTWKPRILSASISLIFVIAGVIGLRAQLTRVIPMVFALATPPDIRAAAWIEENIPQESRFLVNSWFAYNKKTGLVGSDGGWWLPLLTGRQTTLPPLFYLTEKSPYPGFGDWASELVALINSKGPDAPAVLQIYQDQGVTHVYIGQLQGTLNSPAPFLTALQLLNSSHFTPVYQQDRVWIFKIIY